MTTADAVRDRPTRWVTTMIGGLPPDESLWLINERADDDRGVAHRARLAPPGDGPSMTELAADASGRVLEAVEYVRLRTIAHELTDYRCRLPGGKMGRVAIRNVGGEWEAACVRA
jgi:hypothetical protein